MPVRAEEEAAHKSVRQVISFFGGAAKHTKLQPSAADDQQQHQQPQEPERPSSAQPAACGADGSSDCGGVAADEPAGRVEERWVSAVAVPDNVSGADGAAGRPRFLSLDPDEVYDAFDGQRSGLLKPSQLVQRRGAAPPAIRPQPSPPDYRPTEWHGLTRKAFLWSRFTEEDRRLVLQTPRGRRRSVPTAETKQRNNDAFQAAFHKFQELGTAQRSPRGRGRGGARPPPPALVPIWLPASLHGAARRSSGSGESRSSSSGTSEGSPPGRTPAATPAHAAQQRALRRSDGSGSGCGSGSDHVFPMESPEAERAAHRRLSSPGGLSRVRLVPSGPSSHQEVRSVAVAAVSPAAPRPASVPSLQPAQPSVASAQRQPEVRSSPRRELSYPPPERRASDLSAVRTPVPVPAPRQAQTRPMEEDDPDKPAVPKFSSPARPDAGDIEIGLESDERLSADEDSIPEESASAEDTLRTADTGREDAGPSAGEEAAEGGEDAVGAAGERPPPPPRRRVQVERHNSEVHLRLSRSSEQMIRQLERVQYEPGQTDEDGVELRKKKPKSFRRKLKEVLRRAKEDEALLQDFTEYLVVVRPDKMILKRVGDVAREEPLPAVRAARGRGGRHPGQRRQHASPLGGPDDVFSPRQSGVDQTRDAATPPAATWDAAEHEEAPFSPRYGADGSPASAASHSDVGSPPPARESLVEFISRHSQRTVLQARRRCRPPPPPPGAAEDMQMEGATVLPPPLVPAPASPGQSHDCRQTASEKLAAYDDKQASEKDVAENSKQDKELHTTEVDERTGERTPPPPPPPPASSPVQSPDSTQAGEQPNAGYDVSRYAESVTPPVPPDRRDSHTADDSSPAQPPADGDGEPAEQTTAEPENAQTETKAEQYASQTSEESKMPAETPAAEQQQVNPPQERTSQHLAAPLSPPNITITRVSRPPRPPSSPLHESARQLLKRPLAGGQTLPLKKRRLETAEQKSQRCLLLEAACGPPADELPRRAHHLDMALVKGYEFLFQPTDEEHSITRIPNPSFEPALARACPPRPGEVVRHQVQSGPPLPPPQEQSYQRYHQQQQHPQQQPRHPQLMPLPPPPQPHQQQPPLPQQPQGRSYRLQGGGGQRARGKKESAAPVAAVGVPRLPALPVPPGRLPMPMPGPFPPGPLPPPHAMSPSVHALFEAYERAARCRPEPTGQDRHRAPPPPPGSEAAWRQQHLQHQQQRLQQQMELHHQQWLQSERHLYMQKELQQHHMQQQQQQQLQLQQLQQQKSNPHYDHQIQPPHHHQQQQQHHSHQLHYQHHYQPHQHPQQGTTQHQSHHHPQQTQSQHHHQQQVQQQVQQHQSPQQVRQQEHRHSHHHHQQPGAAAVQPPAPAALHGSASSAALSSSWGSGAGGWCGQDPAAPGQEAPPHRPTACYPCPEYASAPRRHVYPALGEPWAPVAPAGWPPRPGAL